MIISSLYYLSALIGGLLIGIGLSRWRIRAWRLQFRSFSAYQDLRPTIDESDLYNAIIDYVQAHEQGAAPHYLRVHPTVLAATLDRIADTVGRTHGVTVYLETRT